MEITLFLGVVFLLNDTFVPEFEAGELMANVQDFLKAIGVIGLCDFTTPRRSSMVRLF